MKNKYTRPEGTLDLYGRQSASRRAVESKIREICRRFGAAELITPMFEKAELYERNVGETTDVVNKEMYAFTRGDERYALRPEITAGAARAYVQNGVYAGVLPAKWFYIAEAFRAERPQKGRYRQFTQFGAEYFGSCSPLADAEVIALFDGVLKSFGLGGVELRINSLGGTECRKKYTETLKRYIDDNKGGLCEKCLERCERSPLRVLDCKNERCTAIMEGAPASADCLDTECRAHFDGVLSALSAFGVKYKVDKRIVRGLDYYTRTVFEFVSTDLGAQSAVGGGGRYDNLIEEMGGSATGAVGFGMGLERLMIILEEKGLLPSVDNAPEIYIGSIGERGAVYAAEIGQKLRESGIYAEFDIVSRSVKAQMKFADKKGAKYVIIIGDDEAETGKGRLKRMSDGVEKEIFLNEIEKEIK